MLSTVENANHETSAFAAHHGGVGKPMSMAPGSQRGLKKKKSAFGWLKKAFTMDEEERAAFEAKRQMQVEGKYYSNSGQKFLDGKRLR